jgi:hypothetical protein
MQLCEVQRSQRDAFAIPFLLKYLDISQLYNVTKARCKALDSYYEILSVTVPTCPAAKEMLQSLRSSLQKLSGACRDCWAGHV